MQSGGTTCGKQTDLPWHLNVVVTSSGKLGTPFLNLWVSLKPCFSRCHEDDWAQAWSLLQRNLFFKAYLTMIVGYIQSTGPMSPPIMSQFNASITTCMLIGQRSFHSGSDSGIHVGWHWHPKVLFSTGNYSLDIPMLLVSLIHDMPPENWLWQIGKSWGKCDLQFGELPWGGGGALAKSDPLLVEHMPLHRFYVCIPFWK